MRNRTNLKAYLPICVFLVAIGCASATGATIYVDASATGANDGSSWANAYIYLQDALADATSGEIWVAGGVYKPDQGAGVTAGDRTATFQLISGVAIYGGFEGVESSREQRNWETNETILSGDLNGDDGPDFANNAENSYHVVSGSGVDVTAVLDGFTITGGKTQDGGGVPNNYGGGMCNWYSNPTVTNCTFTWNYARGGGGMSNWYSSPTVSNCVFSENFGSAWGGGMRNNRSSSPTVTNCTFSGNSASSSSGGGGMCNFEESSPTVTNSTFSGNWAGVGGGMYNDDSSPTVTNCTFSGNSVPAGTVNINSSESSDISPRFLRGQGGGMVNNQNSNATLTNCTFSGNSAWYGGGMWNNSSSPTVTNCILWGNTPNEVEVVRGTPAITYSDVQGGTDQPWFGTGCIDTDPLFMDADLRLSPGSPCINAGSNAALPPDTADLDGDGDTTEDIPLDLDGNLRIVNDIVDMGAYESGGQGPSIITVEIDIKPGSFPNSINLGSKGVIPVAILTTDDFDATTVVAETVGFGPGDALPVHWALEDVDGNGDLDWIFHFKTQETDICESDTEATLIGWTIDSIPISGTDSVRTVPQGKK